MGVCIGVAFLPSTAICLHIYVYMYMLQYMLSPSVRADNRPSCFRKGDLDTVPHGIVVPQVFGSVPYDNYENPVRLELFLDPKLEESKINILEKNTFVIHNRCSYYVFLQFFLTDKVTYFLNIHVSIYIFTNLTTVWGEDCWVHSCLNHQNSPHDGWQWNRYKKKVWAWYEEEIV